MMTVTVDLHGPSKRLRFVTRILPRGKRVVDYQFGLILRTTKVLHGAITWNYAPSKGFGRARSKPCSGEAGEGGSGTLGMCFCVTMGVVILDRHA